jgi:hypothetical protein
MNNVNLARSLLLTPDAAFVELRDRPRFWFPLLFLLAGTVALLAFYYTMVDFPWLAEQLVNSNPRMTQQLSAAEKATAIAAMSKGLIVWSSMAAGVIGLIATVVVPAVYFNVAGNLTQVRYSFKHWLSLCCWISLPQVVALAAAAALLLTQGRTQVATTELQSLSLNELFFHRNPGDPGFALLSALTLLHPWMWWLTAIAMRVWSGRSWAFSWIFALLPSVIFYGAWSIVAFTL